MMSASDWWSASVTTSRRVLVVDPLELLVAIHQDRPGLLREVDREGQLVAEGGRGRRRCGGRHGASHSTASGRTAVPMLGTCFVNVTVSPAAIDGLRTYAPRLPVRSAGSLTVQVVWPLLVPRFVTRQGHRQPGRRPGRRRRPIASNGPTRPAPAGRRRPARARTRSPRRSRCRGPASSTRRAARAGCSARTARRRSATCAPQRAHGCVGAGLAPGAWAEGAVDGAVTG